MPQFSDPKIIKECPFCGGEATPVYYDKNGNSILREVGYTSNVLYLSRRGTVKCKKCEVMLPRTYKTVRYAIKVWNKRSYEQKSGTWIHFSRSDECSICGYDTGKYEAPSKYCPGCGARMENV